MCGCAGRRRNVVKAARALAQGDVKTAIGEVRDFTRTAAHDARRILKKAENMASYKALKRFYQNGRWYEADQVFEMDERDADHLLEGGIVAEESAPPLKTQAA